MSEKPYIIKEKVIKIRKYNPDYGNDRICQCGRPYCRHFDTYDNIQSSGARKEKRRKYNVSSF